MAWNFRKATADDRASIEALFLQMLQSIYRTRDVSGYAEGDLDRFFGDGGDRICVAEDGDTVIAYLSIEVHDGEHPFIYLDDLSVSEEYRNRGIGTRLIHMAEWYAADLGISAVVLHVESSNRSAYRLYRRLGFETDRAEGSRYRMTKRIP